MLITSSLFVNEQALRFSRVNHDEDETAPAGGWYHPGGHSVAAIGSVVKDAVMLDVDVADGRGLVDTLDGDDVLDEVGVMAGHSQM